MADSMQPSMVPTDKSQPGKSYLPSDKTKTKPGDDPRKKKIIRKPQPKDKSVKTFRHLAPPDFVNDVSNKTVTEGEPVTIEAVVKGNPEPIVSWYIDNKQLTPSSYFKTSYHQGICRLHIPEVFPDDEGKYTCRAINTIGSAYSTGKITVKAADSSGEAPRFVEPLEPKTVDEGRGVTFKCKVKGIPPPEVVWLKDNEQIRPSRYFKVKTDPSTGDCSLTINEVFPDDEGTFTCCATNPHGIDETHTYLTVKDVATEIIDPSQLGDSPSFIKAISALIIPEGEMVNLTVQLKGDPEPEITWYYNDQVLTSTDKMLITTEGLKSSLFIPEVFKTDTGKFEVKAVNCAGQAISTSHLTVITPEMKKIPPAFTKPLENKAVPAGEPTILDVEVNAEPQSIFTWYFKSKRIFPSPDFKITTTENKSSLLISETFPDDQGEFSVVAENIAGKATSTCMLSVHVEESEDDENEAPEFISKLTDVKVMDGEEVKLTCRVSANPRPKIQWFHNDREIRSSKAVRTVATATGLCELKIQEVFPEDAGTYTCRAVNEFGEAVETSVVAVESFEYIPDSEIASIDQTSTQTDRTLQSEDEILDVLSEGEKTPPADSGPEPFDFVTVEEGEAPKFTSRLDTQATFKEGEPAKLICRVSAKPKPLITWYRHGKTIKTSEDFTIEEVEDKSILTVAKLFPDDSGDYTCEAVNPTGVDSTTTKITVEELPREPRQVPVTIDVRSRPTDIRRTRGATIVRKLENIMVPLARSKAILRIHVTGQPRPKVTWYHESNLVTPKSWGVYRVTETDDSSILHISSVTNKIVGRYTAQVTNEFGSQTSSAEIQLAEPKPEEKPKPIFKKTLDIDKQKAEVPRQQTTKSFVISQVGHQSDEETLTEHVVSEYDKKDASLLSRDIFKQKAVSSSVPLFKEPEEREESPEEKQSISVKMVKPQKPSVITRRGVKTFHKYASEEKTTRETKTIRPDIGEITESDFEFISQQDFEQIEAEEISEYTVDIFSKKRAMESVKKVTMVKEEAGIFSPSVSTAERVTMIKKSAAEKLPEVDQPDRKSPDSLVSEEAVVHEPYEGVEVYGEPPVWGRKPETLEEVKLKPTVRYPKTVEDTKVDYKLKPHKREETFMEQPTEMLEPIKSTTMVHKTVEIDQSEYKSVITHREDIRTMAITHGTFPDAVDAEKPSKITPESEAEKPSEEVTEDQKATDEVLKIRKKKIHEPVKYEKPEDVQLKPVIRKPKEVEKHKVDYSLKPLKREAEIVFPEEEMPVSEEQVPETLLIEKPQEKITEEFITPDMQEPKRAAKATEDEKPAISEILPEELYEETKETTEAPKKKKPIQQQRKPEKPEEVKLKPTVRKPKEVVKEKIEYKLKPWTKTKTEPGVDYPKQEKEEETEDQVGIKDILPVVPHPVEEKPQIKEKPAEEIKPVMESQSTEELKEDIEEVTKKPLELVKKIPEAAKLKPEDIKLKPIVRKPKVFEKSKIEYTLKSWKKDEAKVELPEADETPIEKPKIEKPEEVLEEFPKEKQLEQIPASEKPKETVGKPEEAPAEEESLSEASEKMEKPKRIKKRKKLLKKEQPEESTTELPKDSSEEKEETDETIIPEESVSSDVKKPDRLSEESRPEFVDEKPAEKTIEGEDKIRRKPIEEHVRPEKPEQVKLRPTVRKPKVFEKQKIEYTLKPWKKDETKIELPEEETPAEEITEKPNIEELISEKPEGVVEEIPKETQIEQIPTTEKPKEKKPEKSEEKPTEEERLEETIPEKIEKPIKKRKKLVKKEQPEESTTELPKDSSEEKEEIDETIIPEDSIPSDVEKPDRPSEEKPIDKPIEGDDKIRKKPDEEYVRPAKPEQVKLKPTVRKPKVFEKQKIEYTLKPVKKAVVKQEDIPGEEELKSDRDVIDTKEETPKKPELYPEIISEIPTEFPEGAQEEPKTTKRVSFKPTDEIISLDDTQFELPESSGTLMYSKEDLEDVTTFKPKEFQQDFAKISVQPLPLLGLAGEKPKEIPAYLKPKISPKDGEKIELPVSETEVQREKKQLSHLKLVANQKNA
ncbi:Uncharacterised protein g9283 [Pycnogonum litorale]